MARRASPALNNDFAEVWEFLKARHIVPSDAPAEMVFNARAIHRATYSLILWRFRLRSLQPHGQVFIEEIASDALQILPQVMMGYGKTTKLLVRGILENSLRHVYFSDHPVEFIRMNREGKWYVPVEQLCEYARNHHEFLKTEKKFDAIAQVTSLYSQLSAGIHGRAVRDLEMRVALRKIVYDLEAAKKDADFVAKCSQAVNFLLAIFHRERMRKFHIDDRRLILHTLPPSARQVWTEHDQP
jgi:hypothetical protein